MIHKQELILHNPSLTNTCDFNIQSSSSISSTGFWIGPIFIFFLYALSL